MKTSGRPLREWEIREIKNEIHAIDFSIKECQMVLWELERQKKKLLKKLVDNEKPDYPVFVLYFFIKRIASFADDTHLMSGLPLNHVI